MSGRATRKPGSRSALIQPDAHGSARLILEGADVAVFPDALQVTREAAPGSATPGDAIVVGWPAP